MTLENIISVISLLGIGGFFGAYFRILWERKSTFLLQKQKFKETRYKCIILLLRASLDFEKNRPKLHNHGREDIKTKEDLKDELVTEYENMILFASQEVLIEIHKFIRNPSQPNFIDIAVAMRKDLWGGRMKSDFMKNLFLQ